MKEKKLSGSILMALEPQYLSFEFWTRHCIINFFLEPILNSTDKYPDRMHALYNWANLKLDQNFINKSQPSRLNKVVARAWAALKKFTPTAYHYCGKKIFSYFNYYSLLGNCPQFSTS